MAEPGLDIEREWGSFREEGRLVGNSPGKARLGWERHMGPLVGEEGMGYRKLKDCSSAETPGSCVRR